MLEVHVDAVPRIQLGGESNAQGERRIPRNTAIFPKAYKGESKAAGQNGGQTIANADCDIPRGSLSHSDIEPIESVKYFSQSQNFR